MKKNLIGPEIQRFRERRGWSPELLAFFASEEGWMVDGEVLKRIEKQEEAISDKQILVLSIILEVPFESFFQGQDAQSFRNQIARIKNQNLN